MFWVDLNILSQKLENSSSVAGEIRGHSFMTSTGKGKWDHRIFADFVKDWGWSWDTVVWPCWTSICTWSKSFFLWYLEDTLNFFASQLFYCFLETCLICSPAMKRLEVRKNFMRFGSSSVYLFSYHAFIPLRQFNIACLLFKYFNLPVEAFFLVGIHAMRGWTATTSYVSVNSRLEAI